MDSAMDARVRVSLPDLARLEHKASGFSFLPRQPITSLLAGRHASRLRGRGLNFEEIRDYLPGDDIRNIDWKVTARLRKPHVRVYTEERDRPAILIVDQRISMFFGSRMYMKSVTAAHVAALAAWRVFSSGDRVGAVVFNDSEVRQISPLRSRRRLMEIFGAIERQNRALRADAPERSRPEMLNEAIERAFRLAGHDHLLVIVSDFAGGDEKTRQNILRAARHNDVLAALVYDPSARELPGDGRLVVTEGELQVEWNLGDRRVRNPISEFAADRLRAVEEFLRKLGIPVLPIDTGSDPVEQIRMLLGRRT